MNKRAFCAGRRVLWGWITIPHGALTMPREITYDAVLNRLNFSPLPEQASLRGGTLSANCGAEPVHIQAAVPLGRWYNSQYGTPSPIPNRIT